VKECVSIRLMDRWTAYLGIVLAYAVQRGDLRQCLDAVRVVPQCALVALDGALVVHHRLAQGPFSGDRCAR